MKPQSTESGNIKSSQADGLARILKAAERSFAEHGHDGVSVRAIAEAAGISKALIYHHFKSKGDLYNSLLQHGIKIINKGLNEAVASGETQTDKLENFIQAFFQLCDEHETLLILIIKELTSLTGPVTESVVERCEQTVNALTEVIKEGISKGEFRDLDPRLTALSLFGQLSVFVSAKVLIGDPPLSSSAASHNFDIFTKGLSLDPAVVR